MKSIILFLLFYICINILTGLICSYEDTKSKPSESLAGPSARRGISIKYFKLVILCLVIERTNCCVNWKGLFLVFNALQFKQDDFKLNGVFMTTKVFYSSKKPVGCDENKIENVPKQKLSIFKRFKAMYRDYWYVLVPVHLVTSAVWFGSFYYMARR